MSSAYLHREGSFKRVSLYNFLSLRTYISISLSYPLSLPSCFFSFDQIYLGLDRKTNNYVAVKTWANEHIRSFQLNQPEPRNRSLLESPEQEVRLLAQLNHPNIVSLLCHGTLSVDEEDTYGGIDDRNSECDNNDRADGNKYSNSNGKGNSNSNDCDNDYDNDNDNGNDNGIDAGNNTGIGVGNHGNNNDIDIDIDIVNDNDNGNENDNSNNSNDSIDRDNGSRGARQRPGVANHKKGTKVSLIRYAALEYCSKGDLYSTIRRGKLPLDAVLSYFEQLTRAVKHLHHHDIAHLDLSAENVFLTVDDVVKLGDFGQAQRVDPDTGCVHSRHAVFQPGKLAYMAPEVYKGDNPRFNGLAADCWSLGVILFAMLTGAQAFDLPHKSDYRFHLIYSGYLTKVLDSWGISLPHEAVLLLKLMLCPAKHRANIDTIYSFVNTWRKRALRTCEPNQSRVYRTRAFTDMDTEHPRRPEEHVLHPRQHSYRYQTQQRTDSPHVKRRRLSQDGDYQYQTQDDEASTDSITTIDTDDSQEIELSNDISSHHKGYPRETMDGLYFTCTAEKESSLLSISSPLSLSLSPSPSSSIASVSARTVEFARW